MNTLLSRTQQTQNTLQELVQVGSLLSRSSPESTLKKIKRIQTKIRKELAQKQASDTLSAVVRLNSPVKAEKTAVGTTSAPTNVEFRFGIGTASKEFVRLFLARLSPTSYQVTFLRSVNSHYHLILEYSSDSNADDGWKLGTHNLPPFLSIDHLSRPMSENQWAFNLQFISQNLVVMDLRRAYLEKLQKQFCADIYCVSFSKCRSRVRLFVQTLASTTFSSSPSPSGLDNSFLAGFIELHFPDADSFLPSILACLSPDATLLCSGERSSLAESLTHEPTMDFAPWSFSDFAWQYDAEFVRKAILSLREYTK